MRFITQGVKVLHIVSAAFKRSFELAKIIGSKFPAVNDKRELEILSVLQKS
jgi:hypothetical protein